MRRARSILIVCLALVFVTVALGVRWGDATLFPPAKGAGVDIFVVSNGFHSGIVLPRSEVADVAGLRGAGAVLAVATRFRHYDWVETGWGDEGFYRDLPTLDAFSWRLALRALFAPGNPSVVHIVGVESDPRSMFRGADVVKMELSREGFARLIGELDGSFRRNGLGQPEELGPGLYGPSLFYRAVGAFSALNLCNHWTARLLSAAGVPMSPVLATWPRGLLLDLKLRSGIVPDATDHPVSASR